MREIWAHVHDAMIEDETAMRSVWWAGFHATLMGHGGRMTWLHFPPPTPVIVDDRRMRLSEVRLRFRTSGSDARISAVHVYDGERCVARHDGLLGASLDWRVKHFSVRGRPFLQYGVGVSVKLVFEGPRIDSTFQLVQLERRIDLAAVGCVLV